MKKLGIGQMMTILANVGVIAGIVFLGYELQQNNDQLQSQSRANIYNMQMEIQRSFFGNIGGITDVIGKAQVGDQLTQTELMQHASFVSSAVRTMEFMFEEDPEYLRANNGWMIVLFSNVPGVLEFYDRTKSIRDLEFMQFVEQEVISQLDR